MADLSTINAAIEEYATETGQSPMEVIGALFEINASPEEYEAVQHLEDQVGLKPIIEQ